MFSQPWAIPLLFAIPLTFGMLVGGREAGHPIHSDNASSQLFGFIALIANIAFIIETIFVADKWWYGLVLGIIAFLLRYVYDFLRSIIIVVIPFFIWQIIEVVAGIAMPILCHILLYK